MTSCRAGIVCCLAVVGAGCDDVVAARPRPAGMEVVTDLAAGGTVGSAVGPFTVRVTDASGAPVAGVLVYFLASVGNGAAEPAVDTSDANGEASTRLRLSTAAGSNALTARADGVPELRSSLVAGTASSPRTVAITPRLLRAQPHQETGAVSAITRDEYGNVLTGTPSWTSRDPALLAVSSAGGIVADVRVLSRPGQTWLVAANGAAMDSIRVVVLDSAASPCAFLATAQELPVGAVVQFEQAGMTCVRSVTAAEYAVIAHYGTAVAAAAANLTLVAHGVLPPPPSDVAQVVAATAPAPATATFEAALRQREGASLSHFVPGARTWYDARAGLRALAATPVLGDVMEVNVNAFEFCEDPDPRRARVAAVTASTMILEDETNPPGGFTSDEYAAIAAAVDSLVIPVDTAAFGAPTDIDRNGRIAVLFTRAVNELTPRGANGLVLGFFYSRDLLPKSGNGTPCPGSNAGELFYVLVPDPNGVASDPRPKDYAARVVLGTIAHELQHLINTSRRLYVTRPPRVDQEVWLNEGLSHVAEELVFFRASGLAPRQNLGPLDIAPGSAARRAYDEYMRGNFGLLSFYMRAPDVNSPLAFNDLLATRGATWSFLRYLADRASPTDGDFWRRIVDSRSVGVLSLDEALNGSGLTTLAAMRDWATASVADDLVPGIAPAHTRPSWNFAATMPFTGFVHGPTMLPLANSSSIPVTLRSGGSFYFHMAAAAGTESLVQVLSGGGVPAPGMRLSLMRIK